VSNTILGVTFGLSAALLWGICRVLDGFILGKTSVINYSFLISTFITIVLLPFVLRSGTAFKISKATLSVVLIASAIGLGAQLLLFLSIAKMGASVGATLSVIFPLFTILISAVFLGHKFSNQFFLGAGLVLLGVILVMSSSSPINISTSAVSSRSTNDLP